MVIPMASLGPDSFRAAAEVARDVHPRVGVRVKINESIILPGILLAWMQQERGGLWWGEVVIVDDGRLDRIVIGAHALTPIDPRRAKAPRPP